MLKHKIKELREAAGMNKAQLGKLIGVSDVTVFYWEKGTIKNIGSNHLLSLGEAFGVSVSELLDDPRKDKPGLEWALSLSEEGISSEIITESIKKQLDSMG